MTMVIRKHVHCRCYPEPDIMRHNDRVWVLVALIYFLPVCFCYQTYTQYYYF